MALAFARLIAMKLYAYRALDYLQVAAPDDRRYLLFNSVQKARVSTEGVKVLRVLSDCVGARGFEANTYLESALREGPMIPALEGSTHINFRMTQQFATGYFAAPAGAVPTLPESVSLGRVRSDESPYWTAARDRRPKTIRFRPFQSAYEPLPTVPNVGLFVKQVEAFGRLLGSFAAVLESDTDVDQLIARGRCLAVVAYGQLVAENCAAAGVAAETVSLIFHGLVEDLTTESLGLAALLPPGGSQRALLKDLVSVPETSACEIEAISAWIASRYSEESTGRKPVPLSS
jgi:acyl-CoA dehydrogenase